MWHKHCSVFLLPKTLEITSVLPDNQNKEIHHIRQLWLDFCEMYPPNELEKYKKLMILLSSTVYDILLKVVHGHVVTSSASISVAESLDIDGDDVYFRFGGAILSEMLHLRNKNKCIKSSSKISQEITILQAKEKSSMPEYLRYRDRGYMYTPHPSFIPFIREVDNFARETANPTGFQEHGHDNYCKG